MAAYKQFCPLLRGLGYGMVLVSSIVMLYYNLIIAWTLYYIFVSITGELSSLDNHHHVHHDAHAGWDYWGIDFSQGDIVFAAIVGTLYE